MATNLGLAPSTSDAVVDAMQKVLGNWLSL